MAFKTMKQKKFGFANKGKLMKSKSTKVKMPKVASVPMPELPSVKPDPIANKDLQKNMPKMKVEKLKIPVGMNARPKWTDSVK